MLLLCFLVSSATFQKRWHSFDVSNVCRCLRMHFSRDLSQFASRSTSWHSIRSASSSGAHVDGASGGKARMWRQSDAAGRVSSGQGSSASSESSAMPDGMTSSTAGGGKSTGLRVFSPDLRPSPFRQHSRCCPCVQEQAMRPQKHQVPPRKLEVAGFECLGLVSLGTSTRRRSVANDKIFVSVVAYRDKECPATIADLFRKARIPSVFLLGYTLSVIRRRMATACWNQSRARHTVCLRSLKTTCGSTTALERRRAVRAGRATWHKNSPPTRNTIFRLTRICAFCKTGMIS